MEADLVGDQSDDRRARRHAGVAEADHPGQAGPWPERVGAAARPEDLGDDDRQAGAEGAETRDGDRRGRRGEGQR
jgi:hypothetical protein